MTNLRMAAPMAVWTSFHVGGDGPASFGTKFSFNYGGGLKVALIEPAVSTWRSRKWIHPWKISIQCPTCPLGTGGTGGRPCCSGRDSAPSKSPSS